MYKRILFVAILVLVAPFLRAQTVIGDLPLARNPNLVFSLPYNKAHAAEVLISRSQYLLSWNKETRIINWAMWLLQNEDLGSASRQQFFQADPDLSRYLQPRRAVQPDDYRGECFDRGHQVSSADRTANEEDNRATFNLSNVIPQTAFLNRTIWKGLEFFERKMVRNTSRQILIITGVILDRYIRGIGPNNDIAVPTHNFKIIVPLDIVKNQHDVLSSPDVIAVIMPNLTGKGTDPLLDKETLCAEFDGKGINFEQLILPESWREYQNSVAEIQQRSGFFFFGEQEH